MIVTSFRLLLHWPTRMHPLPQRTGGGYNRCARYLGFASGMTVTMIMPRDHAPTPKPFRAELVARVRREIAEGKYETPEKLEAALERLFASLGAAPVGDDSPPPPPSTPKRKGKTK